ncbi:hypothetical protein AcW1_005665 [Taiwanofungus camphoratus]|nr:hypothetical protein AcW2_004429 [Antrodia cinnamomea]KAI0934001.1 hypothetical protein AcV5_005991 [Antrodia cinnamomea]KAI0957194.1 hypothetical protein AcW1_005665 [Antrodia cinnamomea]
MSFLVNPTLVTPLLKLPLLAIGATCAHKAMSSPTPPPDPSEAAKYGKPDFMSRTGYTATRLHKIALWASVLCEAAVIVGIHSPSYHSERVLSFLSASTSSASSVRITRSYLAGWLLLVGGGSFRLWCYRTLGRFFKWELSVQKDHKLVTWGPYSIVRHPSYTGAMLASLGTFICTLGPGSWWAECGLLSSTIGKVAACIWMSYFSTLPFVLPVRANNEDKVLRREFPDEWEAWAKKTPYRLIPLIW